MYRGAAVLNVKWRWVVNFTPRPLYPPGNTHRYQLIRTLDGLQSRSGRFLRKETLLFLPGFNPRAVQPVASRDTACTCSGCTVISPLALRPGSAKTQPFGRSLPTTERHFRSLGTQQHSAWTKWSWCLSQFLRLSPDNHQSTIAPCSSVTTLRPGSTLSHPRSWS
jgi:hypothetical protein